LLGCSALQAGIVFAVATIMPTFDGL